MTIDEAVRATFALFAGRYGRKWDIPPAAMNGWAASFEADGVEPSELLAAAAAWSSSNAWPPCFAELRGAIPRLCTCGDCIACRRRAQERATRICNAGGIGWDGTAEPVRMSDIAARLLKSPALLAASAGVDARSIVTGPARIEAKGTPP